MNGVMHQDFAVEFEGIVFDCVDKGFKQEELVDVVIRPEDIALVPKQEGKITGIVDAITFKGVHFEIIVLVNEKEYVIHSTDRVEVKDVVSFDFDPEDIHVMKK